MKPPPCPAGTVRETFRHVGLGLVALPLGDGVALLLPVAPFVDVAPSGDVDDIDGTLRPFETGQGGRVDVRVAPCLPENTTDIRLKPVGRSGQRVAVDRGTEVGLSRLDDTLGGPPRFPASETAVLTAPPFHTPDRDTHPAVEGFVVETNKAEVIDPVVSKADLTPCGLPRPRNVVDVGAKGPRPVRAAGT